VKAEEYRKVIGRRIGALRTARNWSQKSVADYVGCGQSTISKLEAGDAPLDLDLLSSIADALEVSVLVFLPGADKPDLMATLYALYPKMDAGTARSIMRIAQTLYEDDLKYLAR